MTVDPGSNVTLNCSIITGGLVQGMTWNEALERVKNAKNGTGSSNLVLERSMSTSGGKHSCNCTTIKFAREYNRYKYLLDRFLRMITSTSNFDGVQPGDEVDMFGNTK